MEDRSKNLLKNSVVFMIGNFSSKLLMFFLLPLYTNYLDPSAYGQVDIYITILAMLYSFVSLQAVESVFRFIQDAKTDAERSEVITNSLVTALVGIAVFCAVMMLYGAVTGFAYSLVFCLYVATHILSQFSQQAIRGLNRSALYSSVGVISTLVQVGLNVLFIVGLDIGADSLLWSHILTCAVVFLIGMVRARLLRYVDLKMVRPDVIREQLRYSLPLMPNALCLWGIGALGRWLLLIFYSDAEVGLFAFSTKFSQLLGTVNSIFFMAWQQNAISQYRAADRDDYASSIFNKFVIFQLCAVSVLLPAVKFLIFTVMGEEYRQTWMYIPVFFAGIVFNGYANFVSMGFYGAKKTSTVFTASFFAIVLYFLLGYFGAKEFYILGVGAAYAVSQLAYYLIMHIRVRKYLDIRFRPASAIIPLLMTAVSALCYYLIDSHIWQLVPAAVMAGASLYLNRSLIRKILSTVLKRAEKNGATRSLEN